jgi:large conductance mechanosensitive channel
MAEKIIVQEVSDKENDKNLKREYLKSPFLGFIEFIRQQGIVGLAVGFILGDSIKQVVSAVVTDLISPIIGLLLVYITGGNIEHASVQVGPVIFTWGHLVSTLIDFTVTAFVLYFIVKALKFDKLDLPKK